MPDIGVIRTEIARMRCQVLGQRGRIRQLRRAGIPSGSAEALLEKMFNKIHDLCAERDSLKREQPSHKGRPLRGRRW
jgi:hypothetical protein